MMSHLTDTKQCQITSRVYLNNSNNYKTNIFQLQLTSEHFVCGDNN